MGAGSSALPDKLTEQDLQKLCKELYNSFKDSDGFIDREAFIHAAFSGQEKEVHDLFMQHANKDGLMDNQGFTKLCRAAKILNKTNFTNSDAVRVFERTRVTINADRGKGVLKVINYHIFRTLLMPDIAAMKQIHLDNLIFRFSRVESRPPLLFIPLPTDDDLGAVFVDDVDLDDDDESRSGKNEEPTKVVKKVKKSTNLKEEPQEKKEVVEPVVPTTSEQLKAVKRIQSVSRRMIAKNIVHEIKQVKASALSTQDEDFDRTSAGVDIELRLKRIFDYCCRNGEMDNTNFLKLCRDSDVIDHAFTVIDAELCFLKAKTKAISTSEYKSHVFHSKRIDYKVFREILLRCITERKKCAIDNLIHTLLNCEDITRATKAVVEEKKKRISIEK